MKFHRIAVFYYILSKVEYYVTSELAMEWLEARKTEKIIIHILKVGLGLGRNLPDSFVKTFYRWNIKTTLRKRKYDIIRKLRLNDFLPDSSDTSGKDNMKDCSSHTETVKLIHLDVTGTCKQVYASLSKSWWDTKNKRKIKCNKCDTIINITNICHHIGEVQFSEKEAEWINSIRKNWKIVDFDCSPQKTSILLNKCCQERNNIMKKIHMQKIEDETNEKK